MGMAQNLISERENITRISPLVGKRYELDGSDEIPSLKGLGASEAHKALPSLKLIFFNQPVTEVFQPHHR